MSSVHFRIIINSNAMKCNYIIFKWSSIYTSVEIGSVWYFYYLLHQHILLYQKWNSVSNKFWTLKNKVLQDAIEEPFFVQMVP